MPNPLSIINAANFNPTPGINAGVVTFGYVGGTIEFSTAQQSSGSTFDQTAQFNLSNPGNTINGASVNASTGTFAALNVSVAGTTQISTTTDGFSLRFTNTNADNNSFYFGARGGDQTGIYIAYAQNPQYPLFFLDAAGRFYLNPHQISGLDASHIDGTVVVGGRSEVPTIYAQAYEDSSYNYVGANSSGINTFTIDPEGVATLNSLTIGTKPTITGSKSGNAALASLITALAAMGLLTDGTT